MPTLNWILDMLWTINTRKKIYNCVCLIRLSLLGSSNPVNLMKIRHDFYLVIPLLTLLSPVCATQYYNFAYSQRASGASQDQPEGAGAGQRCGLGQDRRAVGGLLRS